MAKGGAGRHARTRARQDSQPRGPAQQRKGQTTHQRRCQVRTTCQYRCRTGCAPSSPLLHTLVAEMLATRGPVPLTPTRPHTPDGNRRNGTEPQQLSHSTGTPLRHDGRSGPSPGGRPSRLARKNPRALAARLIPRPTSNRTSPPLQQPQPAPLPVAAGSERSGWLGTTGFGRCGERCAANQALVARRRAAQGVRAAELTLSVATKDGRGEHNHCRSLGSARRRRGGLSGGPLPTRGATAR